jgi:ArsR family transcriptional regulator, arsenate/arsenite/antimonite-responsive transcriptional repressor
MKTVMAKGKKPLSASRIAGVDERVLEQFIDVLKSAADKSRLLILMILAKEGESHVTAICEKLGQSQPAVSHHLTQLRNAGLVGFRRDGKYNHYALDSKLVADIVAAFFPKAGALQQKLVFDELELTFKTK